MNNEKGNDNLVINNLGVAMDDEKKINLENNKMRLDKVFLLMGILLSLTFGFSFVLAPSSLSDPSFCCEKTVSGAFCVNAPFTQCNPSFKSSPTSCETTSYCRLGTCYDSGEGICLENTPQNVCDSSGGTWDSREIEEVPQCQLGCCLIADQAAFVPLVRCKQLSTYYGVENNYDPSITSEVACIAKAQGQDKGACVFEKDFERTCQFTTRQKCGAIEEVVAVGQETTTEPGKKTFYDGFLCSAEELNTHCAKQTSTTCEQGKVYWKDSCGNLENVYSSDKVISWNKGRVALPNAVCDPSDGTNKNCGNCDYMLGTTCSAWSGVLGIGKPQDSDFFCRRTECMDRNGNERVNGESWCVFDSAVGEGKDKAGSRHFREICVDGAVQVEACEDFRNEICLQDAINTSEGEFGTAACRPNRWQECTFQTEEEDCLNIDKRDCMWLPPVKGLDLGTTGEEKDKETTSFSNPTANNANSFSNPTATGTAGITGNAVAGSDKDSKTTTNRKEGICVPNFPPGLNFWGDANSAAVCGQASAACAVVYEEGLFGGKEIVKGKECLKEEWALSVNQVCTSLGDCGGYVNYNDVYTDDGFSWKKDDKEMTLSPNSMNIIQGGFSGSVIEALRKVNG